MDPLAHGAEVEFRLQVTVEVVAGDEVSEGDGDGLLEPTSLCGADHGRLQGERTIQPQRLGERSAGRVEAAQMTLRNLLVQT